MNSNEKRWIVLLVTVVVIAVVLIVVLIGNKGRKEQIDQGAGQEIEVNEEKYTEELADGTKINTSEEFNSTKKYGNLEISNIQYTEKDGMSVLLADVKNTGSTKHEVEVVKITIIGENGETITEIKPIIGEIESGETIKLNASITADVTNAKDFKIEAVK